MPVGNFAEQCSLKQRALSLTHECAVCGSKAIGINFGAATCAPCKAFFRRNARRREIVQLPCQIAEGDRDVNDTKDQTSCLQLRRCTSCRLRRCFEIGMKEELVRTDEEKQRYRLLIESNRQRRNEILQSKQNILQTVVNPNTYLEEKDWTFLSNIVGAYENYCLNMFRDNRQQMFHNPVKDLNSSIAKIDHHMKIRLNNITSLLKFLTSIPLIQSLPYSERYFLSRYNIRPLILLNLFEIEQTCFAESWQTNIDNQAAEYVYGREIFLDINQIKQRAESILVNDPVITRLWLLILFFSTPLSCFYDGAPSADPPIKSRLNLIKIQDSFCHLLWSYLLHRHGLIDAVRIFSNTIRVYLQMQRISRTINHFVRTRDDLKIMNQSFNQAILLQNQLFDRTIFK